ncbi:MAG: tryptophan 2,3-dioxygenase family protein [Actinomycetota bacterium]|nr:tryptophan 2,3-dioxygenase family protein [Actinomycetota bacterium]
MNDYSVPILEGAGEDDYARYMRTDTLLSLQRGPHERIHRDELLFQVVHQSTELWLKLACEEVSVARTLLFDSEWSAAAALLRRACLGMRMVTDQLEMLAFLSPWDFQTIRTVLGHGSGFESPGWRAVQAETTAIGVALEKVLDEQGIDIAEQFRTDAGSELCRMFDELMEWDERIAIWRVRHYKIAVRIIGHGVKGTKGTPVDTLTRLIAHRFFPRLWDARSELTHTGPMSQITEPAGRRG